MSAKQTKTAGVSRRGFLQNSAVAATGVAVTAAPVAAIALGGRSTSGAEHPEAVAVELDWSTTLVVR